VAPVIPGAGAAGESPLPAPAAPPRTGPAAPPPLPVLVRTAVVEGGLADHLDVHLTLDALDRSHQDVLRLVVGRGPLVWVVVVLRPPIPEGEGVGDEDPARPRHPGGLEHVGPWHVATAHRGLEARRAE